jgi:outer membrane receptor protein involved in Fe transport
MFNGEVLSERRTGKIEPPYSEEYTFYITNNNSARLWINNELVISGWNELWNLTNTGIIYLEAGKKYDICLEYYKNMGTGEIILEWSSQSMPRNVVPQDRFHIE